MSCRNLAARMARIANAAKTTRSSSGVEKTMLTVPIANPNHVRMVPCDDNSKPEELA